MLQKANKVKFYFIICCVGLSLYSCFGAELPLDKEERASIETLSASEKIDRVQALEFEINKGTESLISLQSRYQNILNWLMSWFSWGRSESNFSKEEAQAEKEELQRQITTAQETLAKLKEKLAQIDLEGNEEDVYSLEEYKRRGVLNRLSVHSDFQEIYISFVEAACGFLAKRFGTEKERVFAARVVLGEDIGIHFLYRFIGSRYIKNELDQDRKVLLLIDFFMAKVQRFFGIKRPRVWESKM